MERLELTCLDVASQGDDGPSAPALASAEVAFDLIAID